jgi:superfamily II DNA or RNA helicase
LLVSQFFSGRALILMNHLIKVKSWSEFVSLLAGLSEKEKGNSFEELTLHYLRLHPTYATLLDTVWHQRNIPQEIRKKLNLPNTDEGIDLVARTKNGSYWAIQCKYHEDEEHSLTRKELSTFTDLTFGICKGFELALVCTSADRFSHKIAMYGDRISFIAGDSWRELDSTFFTSLHRSLSNRPAFIKPISPKPHQKEALKDAVSHFVTEGNERGKLIMPCGSGKSLTGWWLAEKLDAKTILIAVPSLALVKQTLEVWARESVAHSSHIRWIAVCSDESVAHDERDDAAVLVQDLGVKVHTDPQEIAEWLKHPHEGITVVFTTYQSGRAIAEASRNASVSFDLGILDEAHKTVGKRGSLFDHLLHDDNITIHRRVFMTATERRYRGDSDNILSMDDPDSYGDTFYLLSFKSALECDPPILSDYKIVTVAVTRVEIENMVKANLLVKPDKGEWNAELEAEMLASLVALRKAMRKFPIRHAVSFHSSISKARAFRDSQNIFTTTFLDYGYLDTFHVTGSTPTAVRKREIDAFAKADRSLITNARCLTEGVDVPSIDCVLFADPKRSAVDIVQAVGRALRPATGKEMGYVVIPVIVDEEGKPEETRFDSVLMVLRALATNDERIVEYFRTVSQGKHYTGSSPVEFTVPDGININADDFINAIELKAWSRLAKLSWRLFEEAREFSRSLKLQNVNEWRSFCKGLLPEKGTLPEDIPASPDNTYEDKGWLSYGDWLGTGTIANQFKVYRLFEEAREFARSLKLQNVNEWNSFCKGKLPEKGILPKDIPTTPDGTYKDKGWQSYGDWLGTGTIASQFKVYKSFEEARDFARSLKLKSFVEWNSFCKGQLLEKGTLPDDIPANPSQTYKDKGWKSIGDWLGTGTVAVYLRVYRPFEEAREFVRSLKLKSSDEWRSFCKGKLPEKGTLPDDIPAAPNSFYKDKGWENMGDWLGTGTVALYLRDYRPFEEAREFARNLKLKSREEWRSFCKGLLPEKGTLPDDIPANPNQTYKGKGWKSFGDWLGTGSIANRYKFYRPFEEAREFARSLKLKSRNEWNSFMKGKLPKKGILPEDIPVLPYKTYKDKGWQSMGDWLGTGTIAPHLREYRPFEEAREFARSLKIQNVNEWRSFCKGLHHEKGTLPEDISASPHKTYKDKGWKNMGDWLGTGTVATNLRDYRPFDVARGFARSLKLKSVEEWRSFCKGMLPAKGMLPEDIPANPHNTYKDNGWQGYGDWLGTGTVATWQRVYRPFDEAREFARNLKLKNHQEWRSFCKGLLPAKGMLPEDIPANPHNTYKDKGWQSMGDWLGTGIVASFLRNYRPFEEAREFARGLKLKSGEEWRSFCKGLIPEKGTLPEDIPANLYRTYKDNGWKSMGDWLGNGAKVSHLRDYKSFDEAREFARSLKLQNVNEWRLFCKGKLPEKGTLPEDISASPNRTYKDKGWHGMGDWLGTGTRASHSH